MVTSCSTKFHKYELNSPFPFALHFLSSYISVSLHLFSQGLMLLNVCRPLLEELADFSGALSIDQGLSVWKQLQNAGLSPGSGEK